LRFAGCLAVGISAIAVFDGVAEGRRWPAEFGLWIDRPPRMESLQPKAPRALSVNSHQSPGMLGRSFPYSCPSWST
jgi:hypothetical protein